jgi:Glyoxalase/Bleomycin resistance protein/Dioxygenase superfamily
VELAALDHVVLCVNDVPTIAFYEGVLGMVAREERLRKWSLHFGENKISLQESVASPSTPDPLGVLQRSRRQPR